MTVFWQIVSRESISERIVKIGQGLVKYDK